MSIEFLLVGIIVIVVVLATLGRQQEMNSARNSKKEKNVSYSKKNFLTKSELSFLSTLKDLELKGLVVIPQVNLATVVNKNGDYKWQSELYRNVDFGIFNSNYELLLLVELNDATHLQKSRQARDAKVQNILKDAEIKLVTFYTGKPNNKEYVIARILNEINIPEEQTVNCEVN